MAGWHPDNGETYGDKIDENEQTHGKARFLLPGIHRQATKIAPQNSLDNLLGFFYDNYVDVSAVRIDNIRAHTRDLMTRLIKFLRRRIYHLTVGSWKEPILVGGLEDQTIIDPGPRGHDVDILFPLSFSASFKKRERCPGYITFLLPEPHQGGKDVFAGIRSKDQRHLSPLRVYQIVFQMLLDAISHTPLAESYHVALNKTDKSSLDIVIYSGYFRVHVIPTIAITSKQSYYVAKPYDYDPNTESDITWRYNFLSNERRILVRVSKADSGTRKRALKIVKYIFTRDPRLSAVSSYHLKTALLHLIDLDIDFNPCWHRETLKNCVLDLLARIAEAVERRFLPHYHIGALNLFHNFPVHGQTELQKFMKQLSEEKGLVRFLRQTMSAANKEVFQTVP